jgi:hypothetical protein
MNKFLTLFFFPFMSFVWANISHFPIDMEGVTSLTHISIDEKGELITYRGENSIKTNVEWKLSKDLSEQEIGYVVKSLQHHLEDRRAHLLLGWINKKLLANPNIMSECVKRYFETYYQMGGRHIRTIGELACYYQTHDQLPEALECWKYRAKWCLLQRDCDYNYIWFLYGLSFKKQEERKKIFSSNFNPLQVRDRLSMFTTKYLYKTCKLDDVAIAQKTNQIATYYKKKHRTIEHSGIDPEDDASLVIYWRVYIDRNKSKDQASIAQLDALAKKKYKLEGKVSDLGVPPFKIYHPIHP